MLRLVSVVGTIACYMQPHYTSMTSRSSSSLYISVVLANITSVAHSFLTVNIPAFWTISTSIFLNTLHFLTSLFSKHRVRLQVDIHCVNIYGLLAVPLILFFTQLLWITTVYQGRDGLRLRTHLPYELLNDYNQYVHTSLHAPVSVSISLRSYTYQLFSDGSALTCIVALVAHCSAKWNGCTSSSVLNIEHTPWSILFSLRTSSVYS